MANQFTFADGSTIDHWTDVLEKGEAEFDAFLDLVDSSFAPGAFRKRHYPELNPEEQPYLTPAEDKVIAALCYEFRNCKFVKDRVGNILFDKKERTVTEACVRARKSAKAQAGENALTKEQKQQKHSPEPLHPGVTAGGDFCAGIDNGGGSNAAKTLAPTSGQRESLDDGAGMENHKRGATDETQKPAAKQSTDQMSFASGASFGLSFQSPSKAHGKTADVVLQNKKDTSESVLQERDTLEPTSTVQTGKEQERQQQPESEASQADGSMLQVAGNQNEMDSFRADEETEQVARLSRELVNREILMRSLLATTNTLQSKLGHDKTSLQDFIADDHVSDQENEPLTEAGRLSRKLVETKGAIESLLVTICQLKSNLGDEETSLQDSALSYQLQNKDIVIGSLLETIGDMSHELAQKDYALGAAHGAIVRMADRYEIEQQIDEDAIAFYRNRANELENGAGDDKYAGLTFDYGSDGSD